MTRFHRRESPASSYARNSWAGDDALPMRVGKTARKRARARGHTLTTGGRKRGILPIAQ